MHAIRPYLIMIFATYLHICISTYFFQINQDGNCLCNIFAHESTIVYRQAGKVMQRVDKERRKKCFHHLLFDATYYFSHHATHPSTPQLLQMHLQLTSSQQHCKNGVQVMPISSRIGNTGMQSTRLPPQQFPQGLPIFPS